MRNYALSFVGILAAIWFSLNAAGTDWAILVALGAVVAAGILLHRSAEAESRVYVYDPRLKQWLASEDYPAIWVRDRARAKRFTVREFQTMIFQGWRYLEDCELHR